MDRKTDIPLLNDDFFFGDATSRTTENRVVRTVAGTQGYSATGNNIISQAGYNVVSNPVPNDQNIREAITRTVYNYQGSEDGRLNQLAQAGYTVDNNGYGNIGTSGQRVTRTYVNSQNVPLDAQNQLAAAGYRVGNDYTDRSDQRLISFGAPVTTSTTTNNVYKTVTETTVPQVTTQNVKTTYTNNVQYTPGFQSTTNTYKYQDPPQTSYVVSNQVVGPTIVKEQKYEMVSPKIENAKMTTVKANNNYDFYEGDIEDLHTGSINRGDDSSTNWGLPFAVLGLLGGLALVGLLATVVARGLMAQCGFLAVLLLVVACLAVIAAAVGLFALISTKKSIARHEESNDTIVSIAFVLCMTVGMFLLAVAILAPLYRATHYSQMTTLYSNPANWGSTFGDDWSFEDGWGVQRRVLLWAGIIALITGICLLVLSVALWKLIHSKTATARILLAIAVLLGGIIALFGINFALQARSLRSQFGALEQSSSLNWPKVLLILLAIAFVLLIISAVWALLQRTSGHCVLGSILGIFAFVLLAFLIFALCRTQKKQREFTEQQSTTCRDNLSMIHETDVNSFCSTGKYLGGSVACTPAFRTRHWETTNERTYVNPGCCGATSSFSTCSMFSTEFFGLFLVACLLLAAIASILLADRSEYLEFSERRCSWLPCIAAVLLLLALVAFILYWTLGSPNTSYNVSPNLPKLQSSGFLGLGSETWSSPSDGNFTAVDLSKVYPQGVPPAVYVQGLQMSGVTNTVQGAQVAHKFSTVNNIISLSSPTCAAGVTNCGYRVAVLLTNGHFDSVNGVSAAGIGAPSARSLFFSDSNIFNDFLLVSGKQAEVQKTLSSLKFAPVDIGKPSRVSFVSQPVNLDSLSASGLLPGESLPSSFSLTNTGQIQSDFSSFNTQDLGIGATCFALNSCNSNLTSNGAGLSKDSFVFYTSSGQIKVNIPLKAFDVNGNIVSFDGTGLKSTSNYIFEGTNYDVTNFTSGNGVASFSVPAPLVNSLLVNIGLTDSQNRYLNYNRSINIPAKASSPYNAFDAVLLTKSGTGCIGNANVDTCFASQKARTYPLTVTVRDAENGSKVSLVKVELKEGFSVLSKTIADRLTGLEGQASFGETALDYYVIYFAGDGRYLPTEQILQLQSVTDSNPTILLRPRNASYGLIEQTVRKGGLNSNEDLAVSVSSDKGYDCVISPENKFCAFGTHLMDPNIKDEGYERVRFDKFAVANYLTYWDGSVKDSATCGRSDPSLTPYTPVDQPRLLRYDWTSARKLAGQYYHLLYCFTGFGLNSIQYVTSNAAAEPVARSVCSPLYPAGSEYSVENLRKIMGN